MTTIRLEIPNDEKAIEELITSAFGRPVEAQLVTQLRDAGAMEYSLVAEENGQIIGHIAFSPVTIHTEENTYDAIGLGPMAVAPDRQKSGVGKAMINHWLENYELEKHNIVVVLGHPGYYPKFGFVPSKEHDIKWEVDVPREAFMVLELRECALDEISGEVRFHPEFMKV